MTIAKVQGAQFEISIDGTPRTYSDVKPLAIEAAKSHARTFIAAERPFQLSCG
jgi:hypothetical protein